MAELNLLLAMHIINVIQRQIVNLLLIVCIYSVTAYNVTAEEIAVYKGVLMISIHNQQGNRVLLLQYRTKTRQVLRIGINDLVMTDPVTKTARRFSNRTTNLSSHAGNGYWSAEMLYDEMSLNNNAYQVEGMLVLYLAESQQTRKFNAFLEPEFNKKSHGSGINWD